MLKVVAAMENALRSSANSCFWKREKGKKEEREHERLSTSTLNAWVGHSDESHNNVGRRAARTVTSAIVREKKSKERRRN